MRLASMLIPAALSLAALGGLSACGGAPGGLAGVGGTGGGAGSGGTLPAGTGGLTIRLHDTPVDSADHVYVTIASVQVTRVDDAGKKVKETLVSTPAQYDLLELQFGVEAVLGSGAFPPGHYKSIRLIVDADTKKDIKHLPADQLKNYIVVEGTAYPLVVPSGKKTGIKMRHDFTITEGVTTSLTFDFDVRKSVHKRGHKHVYTLKPVLHLIDTVTGTTTEGTDDGTDGGADTGTDDGADTSVPAGSISGTVMTGDGSAIPAGSVVSAQQAGVEVGSGSINPATLTYSVAGLPEGTYDLVAILPGFYLTSTSGVSVTVSTDTGNTNFFPEPGVTGGVAGTVSFSTGSSDAIMVHLVWNGFAVASAGIDAVTHQYEFTGVTVDSYTVSATNGTDVDSLPVDVPFGSTATVDLTLP